MASATGLSIEDVLYGSLAPRSISIARVFPDLVMPGDPTGIAPRFKDGASLYWAVDSLRALARNESISEIPVALAISWIKKKRPEMFLDPYPDSSDYETITQAELSRLCQQKEKLLYFGLSCSNWDTILRALEQRIISQRAIMNQQGGTHLEESYRHLTSGEEWSQRQNHVHCGCCREVFHINEIHGIGKMSKHYSCGHCLITENT